MADALAFSKMDWLSGLGGSFFPEAQAHGHGHEIKTEEEKPAAAPLSLSTEGDKESFDFWKTHGEKTGYDHSIFAGKLSEDDLKKNESFLKASKIMYDMKYGEGAWALKAYENKWTPAQSTNELAKFGIDYMVGFNFQAYETGKVGWNISSMKPEQQTALLYMMQAYDHKDWTALTFGRAVVASLTDPLSVASILLAPVTGGASIAATRAASKVGQLAFMQTLKASVTSIVSSNIVQKAASTAAAQGISKAAQVAASYVLTKTAIGGLTTGAVYGGADDYVRQNVEIAGKNPLGVVQEYDGWRTTGNAALSGVMGWGLGMIGGEIFKTPLNHALGKINNQFGNIKNKFNVSGNNQNAPLNTSAASPPYEDVKVRTYFGTSRTLPPIHLTTRTRDFVSHISESYYKNISAIFGVNNAFLEQTTLKGKVSGHGGLVEKSKEIAHELKNLSQNVLKKNISRVDAEKRIQELKDAHIETRKSIGDNLSALKDTLNKIEERLAGKKDPQTGNFVIPPIKDRKDITDAIKNSPWIPFRNVLNTFGIQPHRIPEYLPYWPGERLKRQEKNALLELKNFLQEQIEDIESIAKAGATPIDNAFKNLNNITNNASDRELAANIRYAARAISFQTNNLIHRVTDGDPLKTDLQEFGKTVSYTFKDRMFQTVSIFKNTDYREWLLRSIRESYVNPHKRLTPIERPADQYQNSENLSMSLETFWKGRKSVDPADDANMASILYNIYKIGMEQEGIYSLRHLFYKRGGDISKLGVENLSIGNFFPSGTINKLNELRKVDLHGRPLADDKHFQHYIDTLNSLIAAGQQPHHPGPIWRGGQREIRAFYGNSTFMPRYSFRHRGETSIAVPFKERFINEPFFGWLDRQADFNYRFGKAIDEEKTEAAKATHPRKYKTVFQDKWDLKAPLRVVWRPVNDFIVQPVWTFEKITSLGAISKAGGKFALASTGLWGIEQGLESLTGLELPDVGTTLLGGQLAIIDNTSMALGRSMLGWVGLDEYQKYLDLEKNGARDFVRSTMGDKVPEPYSPEKIFYLEENAKKLIFLLSVDDLGRPIKNHDLYMDEKTPGYFRAINTIIDRKIEDHEGAKKVVKEVKDYEKKLAQEKAEAAAKAEAEKQAKAAAAAAAAAPATQPGATTMQPAAPAVSGGGGAGAATGAPQQPTATTQPSFQKASAPPAPVSTRSFDESWDNIKTLPGRALKSAYTFDGDMPREIEDILNVSGGFLSGAGTIVGNLFGDLYDEKIAGGRWWLGAGAGVIGGLFLGQWMKTLPVLQHIPLIGIIGFIFGAPLIARFSKALMDGNLTRQGGSTSYAPNPNIVTGAVVPGPTPAVQSISHSGGKAVNKTLWEDKDNKHPILSKIEAVDPDGPAGPKKFAVQVHDDKGNTHASLDMLKDWQGQGHAPVFISKDVLEAHNLKREDFEYEAITHKDLNTQKDEDFIVLRFQDKATNMLQSLFIGAPEGYVPQPQ